MQIEITSFAACVSGLTLWRGKVGSLTKTWPGSRTAAVQFSPFSQLGLDKNGRATINDRSTNYIRKKNAKTAFLLKPPHHKGTEVTAGSDEWWVLSSFRLKCSSWSQGWENVIKSWWKGFVTILLFLGIPSVVLTVSTTVFISGTGTL